MIDSPLHRERDEMEALQAERVASRDSVDQAKSCSTQVAMLDSRVDAMIQRIQEEMEDGELTIGEAFKKLDLDGDGKLNYAELVEALAEIREEKRPDARAFEELLSKMDLDHDGQISVKDLRTIMKEMQIKPIPLHDPAAAA